VGHNRTFGLCISGLCVQFCAMLACMLLEQKCISLAFLTLFCSFECRMQKSSIVTGHQWREPDDDHGGKCTLLDASFCWSGRIRQSNML